MLLMEIEKYRQHQVNEILQEQVGIFKSNFKSKEEISLIYVVLDAYPET